ncbi:MAG TPA: flagellar motor switch protein FliN [Methylomirabilota bacterium]|nr:flagellar motor switch protein FliN [Methylomirabilota bacterium]
MADLDDPKAWGLSEETLGNDPPADPFEQLQKEAAAKPQTAAQEREKLDLGLLYDVSLQVTVELGRTRMTVESLLRLTQGSVVELNRVAGEPLDIYVNNKLMARGEAVVIKEKFGVRITDVLSPDKRIEGLG